MSPVLLPPRLIGADSPEPGAADPEALIEEARRRARRRRLGLTAIVAAAAAAGMAALFAAGGGGSGRAPASAGREPRPPTAEARRIAEAARRTPVVESGLMAPGFGWAMNGYAIWLTADGGRTWRVITPPHVARIGDAVARIDQVEFVDRTHGWISASDVVGGAVPRGGASLRHMEIDRTTDGGRTWRWSVPPGCLATCGGAHLSFLDARHGYALTGFTPEPRLWATGDGGARWRLVSRPPFSGAITFLDTRTAVGVSDPARAAGGALFRTTDGGLRWHRVRISAPTAFAGMPETVDTPAFFGNRGVVTVRFRDPGTHRQRLVVYVTADGGGTWTPRPTPRIRLGIDSWGYPNALHFSAAGPSEWILRDAHALHVTLDAGRSWRTVHPRDLPRGGTLWEIHFSSAADGWAIVGTQNGAALVRTTDGGRDWTPLAPRVPRSGGP